MFNLKEPAKALPFAVPEVLGSPQEQASQFYIRIFNELRECYNYYLKGTRTFLEKDDVKLLIGDVLKEHNQQELDYVFWNYSRLDTNGDNEVTFEEFVRLS